MKLTARPFLSLLFLIHVGPSAEASPERVGPVRAGLVSEGMSIQPGRPFWIGLHLQMDDPWHTYWRNPGDSGQATTIAWQLPPGFTAGELQWPVPSTIRTGPLVSHGYEGEVLLLTEITPPADLPAGTSVSLRARADWLVCSDQCVPGGVDLALDLPAGADEPEPAAGARSLFATARAALPIDGRTAWPATYATSGDRITLDVTVPAGAGIDPAEVAFLPYEEFVVEAAQPQVTSMHDRRLRIELRKSELAEEFPEVIPGLLVRRTRYAAGLASASAVEVAARRAPLAAPAAGLAALAGTLASAFLGGMILNLMPCVFPVLGIKILGFVNQSGSDRRKVTLHGLVYTAGVLVSFWVLAGALIALRAGGAQLGWGFQLQSPGFVFGLAVLLLLFGLSLSGVFELGVAATGVGTSLQSKSGYAGSFFTGVLATVVSTPCAAPFLAPALGAALALPPVSALALFTAIGLGLSAPYLVLSVFPRLVRMIPRPGAWMETFKQFMAFPLYGTVAFLVWVLAGQVDDGAFFGALGGIVLVAMAAWAYGRWTGQGSGRVRRAFGLSFAGLLLVGGLALGLPRASSSAIAWREWSPERVAALRADGRIVYVDFTARWCATCKVNKLAVFTSDEVLEAFATREVVALKADWTNKNPEITRALAGFGRSAVPFNLVYGPGQGDPIILPEVLTPGVVLEALDRAASPPIAQTAAAVTLARQENRRNE